MHEEEPRTVGKLPERHRAVRSTFRRFIGRPGPHAPLIEIWHVPGTAELDGAAPYDEAFEHEEPPWSGPASIR